MGRSVESFHIIKVQFPQIKLHGGTKKVHLFYGIPKKKFFCTLRGKISFFPRHLGAFSKKKEEK